MYNETVMQDMKDDCESLILNTLNNTAIWCLDARLCAINKEISKLANYIGRYSLGMPHEGASV